MRSFTKASGVARQRLYLLPIAGAAPAFAAELSPETEDAVCNLLRWLLPPLLVRRGALLLHSAAVVRDGWGYAFFGKSGAGKSTATELIRRRDPAALAVGDDAAIIAWEEGRPWLLSAPLGCGYAHVPPPPRRVPLRGLFSLHQGQSHGLSRCPPSEGLMRLIANSMVADGSHDDGAWRPLCDLSMLHQECTRWSFARIVILGYDIKRAPWKRSQAHRGSPMKAAVKTETPHPVAHSATGPLPGAKSTELPTFAVPRV